MKISEQLVRKEWLFGLWAGSATFLAYCCMYMFRKPFTAGTYLEVVWYGLDYKTVLVIAQVLGYALSKFIGIKTISELQPERRIRMFLGLIAVAWLALVGFAFSPTQAGPLWLFINGLPLGMIWGIVFSYCEGRRLTEVLTVILSANFILSSGLAKTFGRWILALGYSEQMMPMLIGGAVFPLLGLSLWMLSRIPAPSPEEIARRAAREPMTSADRVQLLAKYWIPIAFFVLLYLLLTVIRDVRDNFAIEIWTALGYGEQPEIFSTTELPVTIIVLLGLGVLYRIRDNYRALLTNLSIAGLGILLLLLATIGFGQQAISPVLWMITTGVGLFLPYILLNGILFDRFIAHFRIVGNVGFIMYIADATGYLGSVLILLYKHFGAADWSWLPFYMQLCYIGGSLGLLTVIALFVHFLRKQPQTLGVV